MKFLNSDIYSLVGQPREVLSKSSQPTLVATTLLHNELVYEKCVIHTM